MRDYELVTIVRPDISAQGGEVTKTDVWGRRRMAYPIRDFREGNYIISQVRLETRATTEVERSLKLSEDVLRYLLVRVGE